MVKDGLMKETKVCVNQSWDVLPRLPQSVDYRDIRWELYSIYPQLTIKRSEER